MATGVLEILVEPFKENDPGPHVKAVLNVLTENDLTIDMGPFSTLVEGDLDQLVAILEHLVSAGFQAGATSIQTRISCR
ncbi:MAG: hypothetical protein HKN03_10955 [Acidimicrobiales bacterium]|nr:hypothetical protein [Acidimicrobiales bacterium]